MSASKPKTTILIPKDGKPETLVERILDNIGLKLLEQDRTRDPVSPGERAQIMENLRTISNAYALMGFDALSVIAETLNRTPEGAYNHDMYTLLTSIKKYQKSNHGKAPNLSTLRHYAQSYLINHRSAALAQSTGPYSNSARRSGTSIYGS
jgi:hypothetical protein